MSRLIFLLCLALIAGLTYWAWQSPPPGTPAPRGTLADSIHSTPVLDSGIEVGSLPLFAQYPGELDADISDLASKIGGRLIEVNVRLGDQVKAGAVLATVDDSDLRREYEEGQAEVAVSEANRLRAAAQLAEAQSDLTRLEELFGNGLISTGQIERARAQAAALSAELKAVKAQKEQAEVRVRLMAQQIEDTKLKAPFDGIVSERYLHSGAFVQAGTPIVRLVEAGPLRVRFWVPEESLASVRPGSAFEVTTQSTGKERFPGHVTRLSGEVNRRNRTVAVDGLLDNAAMVLRPGMYAEVQVARGNVSGQIVPGAAVLKRVDAQGEEIYGVFVAIDDAARWRPVRILGRQGDRVALEGALSSADRVLIFGHQDLTDGSRITIVEPSSESSPLSG